MPRRFPGWTIVVEDVDWRNVVNKPAWLARLEYFANNPVKTVLGIVFGSILAGIYDLWSVFLGAIILAWEGSAIGYQPWEQPGLADIPVMAALALGELFSPVAGAATGLVVTWNETMASIAAAGGPLALPVVVGGGAIVTALIVRAAISAASDVPVLGAVLEFLGLT